jgi:hypothetical protein
VQHSPDENPAGTESVTRSDTTQTHEEILEYWTRQRMAEAKPRELRLPVEGPRLKQRGADTAEPGGSPAAPDQH